MIRIAIVLTACGIETGRLLVFFVLWLRHIAIVLTACGIETSHFQIAGGRQDPHCNSAYRLRYWNFAAIAAFSIAVNCNSAYRLRYWNTRRSVVS